MSKDIREIQLNLKNSSKNSTKAEFSASRIVKFSLNGDFPWKFPHFLLTNFLRQFASIKTKQKL